MSASMVFNLICMIGALGVTVVVPLMHGAPRSEFLTLPLSFWFGTFSVFPLFAPRAVRRANASDPALALWIWTHPVVQLTWVFPVALLNAFVLPQRFSPLGPTSSSISAMEFGIVVPWMAAGLVALLWLAVWSIACRRLELDRLVFARPTLAFVITLLAGTFIGSGLNLEHVRVLSGL